MQEVLRAHARLAVAAARVDGEAAAHARGEAAAAAAAVDAYVYDASTSDAVAVDAPLSSALYLRRAAELAPLLARLGPPPAEFGKFGTCRSMATREDVEVRGGGGSRGGEALHGGAGLALFEQPIAADDPAAPRLTLPLPPAAARAGGILPSTALAIEKHQKSQAGETERFVAERTRSPAVLAAVVDYIIINIIDADRGRECARSSLSRRAPTAFRDSLLAFA